MRHLSAILVLCVAGCINGLSAPADVDPQPTAYALASVNQDSLPAADDHASAQRWVLSGSLVLQPDGYYVLSESDSMWNGRSFAHGDRSDVYCYKRD